MVGVDDVAVVDRFAVGGLAAEPVERLADGRPGRERGVVGRHHRAGGPRVIAGQAADVVAFGLRQVPEDVVGVVVVEPVDQVRPVVVRHQVQERRRIAGRDPFDEPDLPLGPDVAHHLGPRPVGQEPQRRVARLVAEVLDQLGDVRRVVVFKELAERGRFPRADQLAEVRDQQRVSNHRGRPSLSGHPPQGAERPGHILDHRQLREAGGPARRPTMSRSADPPSAIRFVRLVVATARPPSGSQDASDRPSED